nr:MAG TPA: hypothetical protein [Caudoviricetes sp.]
MENIFFLQGKITQNCIKNDGRHSKGVFFCCISKTNQKLKKINLIYLSIAFIDLYRN